MTGLLIIGGEGPSRPALEPYLREVGLTIAADSGLEAALRLGLSVDLVVGDMDSLSDPHILDGLPAARVERFPADKDETDTEIGFRMLGQRGCDRVVIAGGGGGRTDHFLGVLMLFDRADPPWAWVTMDASMIRIEGASEIDVGIGEILSFFPVGGDARVVRSQGLRWPLGGLCLRRGYASLSNQATSGRIVVEIGEGRLLMVRDSRGASSGARQA